MDNSRGNIYLTGFMGTGKSTVGKLLARELKKKFMDTDRWIEGRAGASVAEIFSRKGEAYFRKLEREALKAAASKPGRVVALGGGALLDRKNAKLAGSSGLIVRLECAAPILWRRLKPQARRRPLLQGAAPRSNFFKLLRKRRASQAAASWSVSTTSRGPAAAARLIAAKLRREGF